MQGRGTEISLRREQTTGKEADSSSFPPGRRAPGGREEEKEEGGEGKEEGREVLVPGIRLTLTVSWKMIHREH